MTDDRIFARLRTALDVRVEPDAEFADGLYETLALDLGFREGTEAGRGIARPFGRTLGLARGFAGSPSVRLAWIASLAAVLLALALTFALIAGHLFKAPNTILTGDEIVQRSQALYSNPPAFDMTVRFASPRIVRFRYDGGRQLRIDVIAGSLYSSPEGPGSFRIDTATQTATYDAAQKSWNQERLPAALPPLASMFPLNWIVPKPYLPPATPPGYDCPSWQREADGVIADRPAYHVICDAGGDFWIDEASFLVVGSGSAIAATSLTVGPTLDPGLFALAMPAGAYDANNPPPSTVLAVGQPASDWTGSLQGGGTLDTRSLRGAPAAIYFWAEWCDPCVGDSLGAFAQAARSHPGIAFVSVAYAPASETALTAAIKASGAGYPVVRDDANGKIASGWGVSGIPMLVLLRPDGKVASLTLGPVGSGELTAMLVALAAGEPIPSPTVSPAPCACPTAPGTESTATP